MPEFFVNLFPECFMNMAVEKKEWQAEALFPDNEWEWKGVLYAQADAGLYYDSTEGKLHIADCVEFMKSLPNESVDMIFADPPYNIGKDKRWDVWENMEEYIKWSEQWIKEAARILKKKGTMYVCGFSEIIALCQASAMKYFYSCKWTIWAYRNKGNLSNDWGRSHEAILCFRKSKKFTFNVDDVRIPYNAHTMRYPAREQGENSQYGKGEKRSDKWVPNPKGAKPRDVIDLPTTCNGMHEKTPHPTQKPESLVRKYILASSNENDLVFDPFCGSGTTAVCCKELHRRFLSCDIHKEYLSWAVKRLEQVEDKSVEDWIKEDNEMVKRREGIRNL